MFSKSVKFGLSAFVVALGLAATPIQAATFNIALTQNGLNDPGADWFGTFEAPLGGGQVSVFSALIGSTTYHIPDPDFGPELDSSESFLSHLGTPFNVSVVLRTALSSTSQIVLMLFSNNTWAFGDCNVDGCNVPVFARQGTYAVGQVPIPAALPLFAAGVGAMGFTGWRRKRKATA